MTIVTLSPAAVRSTPSAAATGRWRQVLKEAIRDPLRLCQALGLPPALAAAAQGAAGEFPVFVPAGYLARMRPGDPDDPLLRQVLPVAEELVAHAEDQTDPVADSLAALSPGLLHKYHSRVLMVTTGACAVHCRYCFRRHFPYAEAPRSPEAWAGGIAQIASDASISEVLLSGGDPLTLVDPHLAQLAAQLAAIKHVRRLRVHTRLPILIPERVTDELIAWLTGTRLAPILVIHANHAAELDDTVAAALVRLAEAGVVLLNQSVLLRGVNDSVDALAQLSERLIEIRVTPYYLHQLDRVRGAAHFEVPIAQGLEIMTALRARLPGYLVPRYVQEIPGQPNKTVLA